METWSQTNDWLELLFNVALLVIPALIALAGASAGVASIVKTARWLWSVIRPAVDEETDPAVLFLAAKSGRSPAWISKLLVEHGDQVIAVLPSAGEAVK